MIFKNKREFGIQAQMPDYGTTENDMMTHLTNHKVLVILKITKVSQVLSYDFVRFGLFCCNILIDWSEGSPQMP